MKEWTDEQVGAAIVAHHDALKSGSLLSEAWRAALSAASSLANGRLERVQATDGLGGEYSIEYIGPHTINLTPVGIPDPPAAAVAFVPGVMFCSKCKFRLVRKNLYVLDGTVGAGDNKTEPCPNGCGPLWPVTWEQEARECWTRMEEMATARAVAPWPDFAGNPIHDGDTIKHPADGMTGVVFVLVNETEAAERWRVLYGDYEPGRVSRLCLQVGDKGQAVVVAPAVVGDGRG